MLLDCLTLNLFLRNEDISTIPDLKDSHDLQESEHEQLAECLSKAFGIQHGVWEASRITKEFLDEKTVKKTFRLFDNKDGASKIAATASLRIIPDKYPGSGYMHWVAVHPDYHGEGLGTVIAVAVLHEARDIHGMDSCVLETQDTSFPAIRTYEKLGFSAVFTHCTHEARWVDIRAKMAVKAVPVAWELSEAPKLPPKVEVV